MVLITKQSLIDFVDEAMSSQTQPIPNITLRPVVAEDYPFLLEVYGTTRAQEMTLVPWTDEQRAFFVRSQFDLQQHHYKTNYPTAKHDIIFSDGKPVGQMYVARLEQEIRIVDFIVLPAERNAGIGSYLLKKLLAEARIEGKPTRVYVEDFNPSLSFFKRLGFTVRQQDGFHLLMEMVPLQKIDD